MKELFQENNQVFLCRGKGCCPNLQKIEEDKVLITDDDGNKMVLSKEQALMIPEAIEKLDDE
jgi:hypothetical protein